MGCWNATCFISNLPILAGEPCVGFLITATGKMGVTSYPDERYRPITPPIEGTYDDYGGLSFSPEQDTGELHGALCRIEWLKNKELDHPIVTDSMTELFSFSQDEKIVVSIQNQRLSLVVPVLMKRCFYEYALDAFGKDNVQRGKLLHQKYSNTNKRICQMLCDREPVSMLFKRLNKQEIEQREALYDFLSFRRLPHPIVVQLIRTGIDFTGMAAVDRLLDNMRRQWVPTSGAGSQRELDTKLQLGFYQKMYELAEEMYQESQSDCEEY